MTRTNFLLIIFVVLFSNAIDAQKSYSLLSLLSSLESKHPLASQSQFYESITKYQLSNVAKNWLPQAVFSAQATYQSAVAGVTIPTLGLNLSSLPKDQYKATIDLSQALYDGGMTKAQKTISTLTQENLSQKNKIDLYSLKQQVISQFMNVLLCDKNMAILDLSLNDMSEIEGKTKTLYTNQYATKANLAQIKSQIIKTTQKKLDIAYAKKNFIKQLSILCDTTIEDSATFDLSSIHAIMSNNSRPEIKMFDLQTENALAQIHLIKSKIRPKLNLFAQGGYGRPGLNMLSPNFDFFYIAGIKLSVPISSLYTFSNDLQLSKMQANIIQNQKEVWQKNMDMQSSQNKIEFEKIQHQLTLDNSNIENLELVVQAAKAKYTENQITVDEYTRQYNELENARINKSLNQTLLLMNQLNALTISGKIK